MRQRAATTKRTAAAIAAEIDALDAIAGERAKALATLEERRPALVAAGDVDGVEALDARIRRARIEAEIDGFRRGKLAEEHAQVKAAEEHAADQAERRAAYAAARAAAGEARSLFADRYPALARELVALLTQTDKAKKQIEAANARLPDDAAPIGLDFEPSRGRGEIPARKTPVKRHAWVHKKSGKVSVLAPTEDRDQWRKEVTVEEVTVEAVRAVPHVPLHDLVALPGLAFGDADFWSPRRGIAAAHAMGGHDFRMHALPAPVAAAPLLKSSARTGR